MTRASHYVIKDLYNAVDEKNPDKIKKITKKLSARYPRDHQLKKIIEKIKDSDLDSPQSEGVSSKSNQEQDNEESDQEKAIEEIKKELKSLLDSRKVDTSGGTKSLDWLRERR